MLLSLWAAHALAVGRVPSPSAQESASAASGLSRLWVTALKDDQPVKDLKADELQLFLGKDEQSIQQIEFNPREPLNLGLLVDISASRSHSLPGVDTDLAPGFFRQLLIKPGDQFFGVMFNDKAFLLVGLTDAEQELNKALERAHSVAPRGGTALYDAVFSACDQKSPAVSKHRVLVVVTDGQDNASHHTAKQALELVRQTGTIVYVIVPKSDRSGAGAGSWPRQVLNQLVDVNGGKLYDVGKRTEMARAFTSIAEVLRSQYVLDFRLASVPGGNAQRIKIKCSRRGVKIIAPRDWLQP